MDEKELKTSLKTRIFIIFIAILMLGSIVASYALIVANGGKSESVSSGEISEEKLMEYEEAYEVAMGKMASVSEKYYSKLLSYKNRVKGFNEASAESEILKTEDLEVGSGRELGEEDMDYVAYYIGWCGDETVFDSSFDDFNSPTKLRGFYDVKTSSSNPIDGWMAGVEGMKLGGVRELTISSDLAYKDGEICEKTYQPIKFVVFAIAREGEIETVADEVFAAQTRLQYAYYGIDYDSMVGE